MNDENPLYKRRDPNWEARPINTQMHDIWSWLANVYLFSAMGHMGFV